MRFREDAMRYMLLIYSGVGAGPEPNSEEAMAEMQEWFAYTESLEEAGVLLGGDPLHPAQSAVTVRAHDGAVETTDGPFAETKEILGGYYIIEVDSAEEAIAWGSKIPTVRYGSIEVRRVLEIEEMMGESAS